jgi:hypothetical protein
MNGRDVQVVRQLPARNLFGLNAANFFQLEMIGVILSCGYGPGLSYWCAPSATSAA